MISQQILGRVRQYAEGKLAEHGATPRGVDWNSGESQQLRFRELVRVCADDPSAGVNDYGCGYGAFAAYLRASGHTGPYRGFDISRSDDRGGAAPARGSGRLPVRCRPRGACARALHGRQRHLQREAGRER